MKLILLESYEADLSNSGYNIQFGEELTEIQTNLYSVCKHSDTFLAHCMFTRPDIAFSVQCISQFNSNPGLIHWAAVKRIFHYLCGTTDYCLVLGGDYQNGINLQGWSDVDFARDPDDR